jgi:FkbM family methyltransferase
MFFYTQGWRGIHAEPNPFYAKILREARPDEVVIEAAIGDSKRPTTLFVIDDTGLTTSSKQFRDQHKQKGFNSKTIKVPTKTLASILDEVEDNDIHWLKIDAEGMEDDVIRSWGNSLARPWIVVVESTLPSTNIEVSYGLNELTERGYTNVYFDALNKFYVHKLHSELLSSFKHGPNMFDDFIRADHKVIRDQAEILNKDLIERTKELVDIRGILGERTELLEKSNEDLVFRTKELVGIRAVLEERTKLLKKTSEDLGKSEKALEERTQKLEQASQEIDRVSNKLNEEQKMHNALLSHIEKTLQELNATKKDIHLVAFASNPFMYFMLRGRIKKLFRKINPFSIHKNI